MFNKLEEMLKEIKNEVNQNPNSLNDYFAGFEKVFTKEKLTDLIKPKNKEEMSFVDSLNNDIEKLEEEFNKVFSNKPNKETQSAMEESRKIMKNKNILDVIDCDKEYYIANGYIYILVEYDDVETFEDDNQTYIKYQVSNDTNIDLPDNCEYMEFKNKKYITCLDDNTIEIGEYYAIPIAKIS